MTGRILTNATEQNSEMNTIADAFAKHFRADSRRIPAWPQSYRDKGFSSLSSSGFPQRHSEEWKYTNLDEFIARSANYLQNSPNSEISASAEKILQNLPDIEHEIRVIFVNGLFLHTLPANTHNQGKITVTPFSGDGGDNIARNRQELVDRNPLIAFNSAFLADGLRIEVADEQNIDRPVHVVFVTDGQPCTAQPRLEVYIGRNASASILQHHIGRGAGLTNIVTEIECADYARLSFLKLQNESTENLFVCNLIARLANNASLDFTGLDFGGKLARTDIDIDISGQDGVANLHGLFMANENRHVDNHLSIHHKNKDTRSMENFRGIISDAARGVFNGKIIVHSGADGTDANMSNRNLLLGDNAEIDTKPELEIYTDDVKCAHGSTTGRLDMDALFYLRARGIPAHTARTMLVAAFAEEIISQVCSTFPDLSEHLENIIDAQLPEKI